MKAILFLSTLVLGFSAMAESAYNCNGKDGAIATVTFEGVTSDPMSLLRLEVAGQTSGRVGALNSEISEALNNGEGNAQFAVYEQFAAYNVATEEFTDALPNLRAVITSKKGDDSQFQLSVLVSETDEESYSCKAQ